MPKLNSQAAAEGMPKIEEYWALQRVNDLSKQIAAELSKIEGYHLVIIRPSDKSSHPVSICLDKEFADMLQSVTEMREGAEHAKSSR